ncbi:DUF924 family protein [Pseudogulbenkiania subflava]|uniref:Uncharacterized conserved protein, DUF924 family n=1 Tax=Pseudogulbenkiania subflava DSM 22618 TaxID=1123014 RepID=A0A1Y6BWA2_9NEIS|nr:DUF924 family protein [Pseudogulbenkiania subflava]SMF31772.1 Uncharacterized conserved protein, DUF924 family [Pseudogulbenkiania subflava DSM 22618]
MLWHEAVLSFWFGGVEEESLARERGAWFRKDAAFDETILQRFLTLVEALEAGALSPDLGDARATLAWLIVADQFPRNLFRGTARAFGCDARAREVARQAVAVGLDTQLPPVARWFVYLPFEHGEALADQDEAVRLFATLAGYPGQEGVIDYARRHRKVIERFGRFPHRNAVLGRESTVEEVAFLEEPGSSF